MKVLLKHLEKETVRVKDWAIQLVLLLVLA